jgi:hypothetical protein
MKKAGRSLATILLHLTLTVAAFAGQMDTPPAPTPGGGQMDTPPATYVSDTATTDTLTELALDIWNILPSLY